MLLGARFLANVGSANSFNYMTDPPQWTAGDTVDVYLQLIDQAQDLASQGYKPAGRRYMPAAGATLSATLTNVDDAIQLTSRPCVQVFPTSDPSIWRLSVLATDAIVGSTSLSLTLNEAGRITTGWVACGPRIRAAKAI